jgi:hypothetical protein
MDSEHHRRLRARRAIGVMALIALGACGSARTADPELRPQGMVPGGVVVTQEDIAGLRAFTAMDVLKRARSHLTIARTRAGRPVRVTGRGRTSLVLSPELLLVVDGARAQYPIQLLQSIPAESIVFMQILTGREAALQWGSEAGNGVIVVKTSAH